MNIGSLYRLTKQARNSNQEKMKRNYQDHVLCLRLNEQAQNYVIYNNDSMIVPLEIHKSTVAGMPLKSEYCYRLKVLMTDGMIGEMYVSIDEWEEVFTYEKT